MGRKIVITEITLMNLLKQVRRAEGKLHQVKNGQELINEIDYAVYSIGKEAYDYQPELLEELIRETRLEELSQ